MAARRPTDPIEPMDLANNARAAPQRVRCPALQSRRRCRRDGVRNSDATSKADLVQQPNCLRRDAAAFCVQPFARG